MKGFLRVGKAASSKFAIQFQDLDAFGIACQPNNITVLDVDTPDERVLSEALSEFGETPFIVRSGSGNHQAWYRNGGEGRLIRNAALEGAVLSPRQLHFLDMMIDHLTSSGSMDPALLYEAPFTDEAPNGVSDVFELEQVKELIAAINSLAPRFAATQ